MTKSILIAGLGLIGGSIAKNIKFNHPSSLKLYGYDHHVETLDYARSYHIVDGTFTNFQEAVQAADIVFLATPIHITIDLLEKMKTIPLEHEVIVTDVSSVKGPVLEKAEEINNSRVIFIGGHPMAGSHKQGIEAARSHLFENAYYVLTPSRGTRKGHMEQLKDVLKYTKSHFVELNPEEHDLMTGVVSHFPHLIASALVHQAKNWEEQYPFLPHLAAGGFRDITRIASSNPQLWQDIFFQNRAKMIKLLSDWMEEMKTLKRLLTERSKEQVISYLTDAKRYRDGLPKKEKGAIPTFNDLYVDIYDQPGELYKVIKWLADDGINIVNIQILEIRENMTGVLQLTLQTEEELHKAKQILTDQGYQVSTAEAD
ncbi:MAG: prephenate dehydrogenase [Bacillaceae bacterium]|nr:prephenate dehydrogenase [Bacillaceae bacterium]